MVLILTKPVARVLHSPIWTEWMVTDDALYDLSQRVQAVMADAQKSATLVAGVDEVLTTTHLNNRAQSYVRLRLVLMDEE